MTEKRKDYILNLENRMGDFMGLDSNNQLLVFSLLDQMLDELPPVSSFVHKAEYQSLYSCIKGWKSRKLFLNRIFFDKFEIQTDLLNFPIELETGDKTSYLSDVFGLIPIEFQYLKREKPLHDILLLRSYIDSKKFKVASVIVTEDILLSIQNCLSQEDLKNTGYNLFELACFRYVKKFGKNILENYGKIFPDWNAVLSRLESDYHIFPQDFSPIGKYLWQIDYLCFDNRKRNEGNPVSLLEQLEQHKLDLLDSIETLTIPKKKKLLSLKSLFVDEHGNYWKNEESYLAFQKATTTK